MIGQRVGWHLRGVVKRAGDDRLIGIALKKIHHHFLRNARPEMDSPFIPCPGLGDAYPASAVFIVLTFPVPVELHPHSTILVEPAFFTILNCDHRCLRSLNKWFRGDSGWPNRRARRNTGEGAAVRLSNSLVGNISGALIYSVIARGKNVVAVGTEMLAQLKFVSRDQVARIRRAAINSAWYLFLFHADSGQIAAFRLDRSQPFSGLVESTGMTAGIVIN